VIPTVVLGAVMLSAALALADFVSDFLFTDMCLDSGGKIEAGACVGPRPITTFGFVPYAIASAIAIMVTFWVSKWLRRSATKENA
jgi:hypothetical protein